MREIKFRTLVNGEWLYFDLTQNPKYWAHKLKDGIIDQYTGLKGVNGKEIFIGDIVKREFEVWETTGSGSWEDGSLEVHENCIAEGYFIGVVHQTPSGLYVLNRCKKYNPDGDFIEKRRNIKLHARYANVIGNIYENKDLLEDNKNE